MAGQENLIPDLSDYIQLHNGGHEIFKLYIYAYCSDGSFAGVAFNNCSQFFTNVYIHRDVGVQDRNCSSGRLPMRDLSSAPWMAKYAQNKGGANAPPCGRPCLSEEEWTIGQSALIYRRQCVMDSFFF